MGISYSLKPTGNQKLARNHHDIIECSEIEVEGMSVSWVLCVCPTHDSCRHSAITIKLLNSVLFSYPGRFREVSPTCLGIEANSAYFSDRIL